MTLKTRKTILSIMLAAAFAGTVLSAAALSFMILHPEGVFSDYHSGKTIIWWSVTRDFTSSDTFWAISLFFVMSLYAFISELVYRKVFGKSPSAEMFFLRFFILTLPFQSVRILIPLVSSNYFPLSWEIYVTRIAWFARFAGLTALLNIGIFSSGDMPFQRSGAVLGIGLLASLGITVTMPLDITIPLGNLLIRSGAEYSLELVCLSIKILAVISLAGIGYQKKQKDYYFLSLYMLIITSGAEMIFFASMPLVFPGTLLLVSGTVLFSSRIKKMYQWI